MTELSQSSDPTYRIAVSRFALSKKIPFGDPFWGEFNGSFTNKNVTAIDLANHIYAGYSFTTWHKDGWRKTANYQCGQHVGLDFDTEDERSTLAALAKDRFIARYASMIYTTISHQPDKPRARVVFLLDKPIMQATNYALSAQALLWFFGTADRQCKDPVRFFYGAPGCQIEYLENVLPLAKVQELIAIYKETGLRERRRQDRTITGSADQQDVTAALQHIQPWSIDYDDWLRILMALHSEYGDAGLNMAEQWADGKSGEIERKWRSFKETGNVSGTVTIGSLFEIAKRFGWQKIAM